MTATVLQGHGPADEAMGRCICGWESKASTEGRRRAGLATHLRAGQARLASTPTPDTAVLDELEIWEDRDVIAIIQKRMITGLQWYLRPFPSTVVGVILIIWIAYFLTYPVRESNPGWVFAITSILVVISASVIYGTVMLRRFTTFLDGKPILGSLGGLPSHIYRYALLASQAVQLQFAESDQERVRQLSDIDAEVTECILRWRVETNGFSRAREPLPPEVWLDRWEGILSKAAIGSLSLKDTIAENSLAFNFVLPRLAASTLTMSPMLALFSITLLPLITGFVIGAISAHIVAQTVAAVALLMALSVALIHKFVPDEVSIEGEEAFRALPPDASEAREQLQNIVDKHLPAKIRIASVVISSQYGALIRKFHVVRAVRSAALATVNMTVLS